MERRKRNKKRNEIEKRDLGNVVKVVIRNGIVCECENGTLSSSALPRKIEFRYVSIQQLPSQNLRRNLRWESIGRRKRSGEGEGDEEGR